MTSLTTSNPPQKKYRSYLLRLWCEETVDPCWQASLEDPHTGKRIGFASLEQLFTFLMDQVEGDAKGVKGESNDYKSRLIDHESCQ
jgi:hypothetical protein